MKYEITSPTGQRFEVTAPDDASHDQVLAYAQSQFQQPVKQEAPLDPTTGMSDTEKFFAGMGKGMTDIGQGIKQRLGLASPEEVAQSRKYDAPLMNTGAGKLGSFAGGVTAMVPSLIIPGANTVAGAAAIGGLTGALQPTAPGESVAQNAALGAATGGAAQYGLGKAASFAGNLLSGAEAKGAAQEAQNAVRDAMLKASQDAGYQIPPSMANSGVAPRVLEGISGKTKTNQAMSIGNQNVTEQIARKAVGLAPDAPLTSQTMQGIRNEAFAKGYAPVTTAGVMKTGPAYEKALDAIAATPSKAANSFPNAVKDEVRPFIDSMRVKEFDAGDAVAMTKWLREKTGDAYSSGNKELGRAYRGASDALENEIERNLALQGKNGVAMLQDFRDARKLMAKTHTIEAAIREGSGTLDARRIGQMFQKKKPLSDGLETIGAFANNFPEVAGIPKAGYANPITVLDAFGTAASGAAGAGLGALAMPAARIASRALLTSPAFQRLMVNPSYGPGLLGKGSARLLGGADELGLGGLLAPAYAKQ